MASRTIRIERDRHAAYLIAPYHPDLAEEVHAIDGEYDERPVVVGGYTRAWRFAPGGAERAADLARRFFGTDGSDADDPVSVRIRLHPYTALESKPRQAVYLGGHEIGRAFGRGSVVQHAPGVVMLEGGVTSGGLGPWRTRVSAGSVFEMRDLPRGAANKVVADARAHGAVASAELVEAEPTAAAYHGETGTPREELMAERERLVERIAEIDAALTQDDDPLAGADGMRADRSPSPD